MSLIFFLIVLSGLVIFHEFGHFFAARMFGIKADEFGFGFPPRIFGFVREKGKWKYVGSKDQKVYKNTIWSLNWLPLGGFVRIKGEQEDGINDADSIHSKPIWQRIVVIAAGVMMNWILAIILLTGVYAVGTTAYLDELPKEAHVADRAVIISEVLQGSPAEKAGIMPGDRLVSVAGQPDSSAQIARDAIAQKGINNVDVIVTRNGAQKTFSITPQVLKELNHPGIGVALDDIGTVSFPLPLAFYNGVRMTWLTTKGIVVTLGVLVRDLFVKREVPADLSGPIGIAVLANQFAKQGITPFLQFAALLSINLAVINFLPIPALDGGRVLFLIIEKVRRKPMNRNLENRIHNIAFLVLISIIILVSIRDVSRYGGVIVGGVRQAVGL